MAKEKFLIVATPMIDDCFGRFSETDNRAAISDGTMDERDAYAWIEKSFEIHLVRYREATHICSFTPSAHQVWLQNYFVGEPNAKWDEDGDPEGLEYESGGETHGYGTYYDDYDPRFVCETFVIDTMRDLDEPMRAPSKRSDKADAYLQAIWEKAEEVARESVASSAVDAPILSVIPYRRWEKEQAEKRRIYHAPVPFGAKASGEFRL
jgi:hypothetical protein